MVLIGADGMGWMVDKYSHIPLKSKRLFLRRRAVSYPILGVLDSEFRNSGLRF